MRCSGDDNDYGAVILVRTRSKAVAEQRDGSDGKGPKDSGGEGGSENRDIDDSTVSGAGADAGVAEGHVDNPGLNSVDGSDKGDNFENNSGETSKDGTKRVQTVNLEANRIFVGEDIS